MIRKQGEKDSGGLSLPASFTLHEADFGAGGVFPPSLQTFSFGVQMQFTVIERPVMAMCGSLVAQGYLAPHGAAAEEWLSRHRYPNAVLGEATADVIATHALMDLYLTSERARATCRQ